MSSIKILYYYYFSIFLDTVDIIITHVRYWKTRALALKFLLGGKMKQSLNQCNFFIKLDNSVPCTLV